MNERELFLAALERQDPRERDAFLDQACAGDAALRSRIEALLRSQEETGAPARPAVALPSTDRQGTSPQADATGDWTTESLDPDQTTDGDQGPSKPSPGTMLRYFGDYELLKELGRGGMGVVFKAKQVSLNRPVALKMIKAGILADDAELIRFQNEAQAVALLDHAGIVPIFEVGQHEGQRYFSMKLVEGGNLAEKVSQWKDNPRAIAALVAETAEAVHHAHMRGILHRDLKPANILIDGEGHPHVTDFGLAKLVEADVELTASGAILGTPAYMSPEQAAGRRGTITTATDVYGLGAILYALLTGKAPFGGDSLAETLQAVKDRPPEAPHKLNEKVPRDLETICLKCLEKEPRRRYTSAHALADDLRAWLDSRPISARRVGAAERAWLWCKRRPAVAALAASVALAVVGGTVGIIIVQAKAYNDLQALNIKLDKQRIRAESREGAAIDAVRRFHHVVDSSPQLRNTPSLEPLRRVLLKEPLAFFRSLRTSLQDEDDTRPESLARFAQIMHEYAHITESIGNTQDGLESHDESLAIWDRLHAEHPGVAEYQFAHSTVLTCRGNMLSLTGKADAARKDYEAAIAIQQKLLGDHPDVLRYKSNLATGYTSLGNLLSNVGEIDGARKAYDAGLEIRQKLVEADPAESEYLNDLGAGHYSLASLLSQADQPADARKSFEAARLIQEELVKRIPTIPEYRRNLALTHNGLGVLLRGMGEHDAAKTSLEAGRDLQRNLVATHPTVSQYAADLAASYTAIGVLFRSIDKPDEARKAYEEARPIQERLAREHPEAPDYACDLAAMFHNLGNLDLDAKSFGEARDKFQKAIEWEQKAIDASPKNAFYRQSMAKHENGLNKARQALGLKVEAVSGKDDQVGQNPTDPATGKTQEAKPKATTAGEPPKPNADRLGLAQRAYDTQRYAAAAKLWAEALEAEPKLADSRRTQHRYNAACAAVLASRGEGKDDPPPDAAARDKLRSQALDWLKREVEVWKRISAIMDKNVKLFMIDNLSHWMEDTDLATVREAKELAKLPEAEQKEWKAVWADVASLLESARASNSGIKP